MNKKKEKKRRIGRPAIIEMPEELCSKAEDYVATENRPSLTGLAHALGYKDKDSLRYNATRSKEFADAVEYATALVDRVHEENLFSHSCTGSIFYLKQRGWKDKQEVNCDGQITLNIVYYGTDNPT